MQYIIKSFQTTSFVVSERGNLLSDQVCFILPFSHCTQAVFRTDHIFGIDWIIFYPCFCVYSWNQVHPNYTDTHNHGPRFWETEFL